MHIMFSAGFFNYNNQTYWNWTTGQKLVVSRAGLVWPKEFLLINFRISYLSIKRREKTQNIRNQPKFPVNQEKFDFEIGKLKITQMTFKNWRKILAENNYYFRSVSSRPENFMPGPTWQFKPQISMRII